MLVQFEFKDIIGPVVSTCAAVLSAGLFLWNFRLSRRLADRSLNLEGQKMLIEINRQLIADPWLWALYDDHEVRKDPDFEGKCGQSICFQAKLRAFAYLSINMFEIVLAEIPSPKRKGRRNESAVWIDFFEHAIAESSIVREILEHPHTVQVYSPALMGHYARWKESEERNRSRPG